MQDDAGRHVRSVVLELAKQFGKHRLVHFLAVGGLIAALAPRSPSPNVIAISEARIFEAERAAEATSRQALTPSEKAAVVQSLVDDEVLAREAQRTGVGTDDAVVRARLAAAMRASVARSTPVAVAPAPRLRVAVWFAQTEAAAEVIAKSIRDHGIESTRAQGDRPPIPDGAVWTASDLAQAAGAPAAEAAFSTELGKPTSAIASAWGFYVLVPLERLAPIPTATPNNDDVDRWLRRARRDYEIKLPPGVTTSSTATPARVD
jgi:hypothetical protein